MKKSALWTKRGMIAVLMALALGCASETSLQMKAAPEASEARKSAESVEDHAVDQRRGEPQADVFSSSGDAAPEITQVYFVPKIFRPGDTLGVQVSGRDPDGDAVAFRYEWYVNDRLAGKESRLRVPLRRGDHVFVQVTPYDQTGATGPAVTLEREVLNLPPILRSAAQIDFDGETYLYQLHAEDPDGDPVTYQLEEAPEGMTITPDSGLITWNVPPTFQGVREVCVLIQDDHGGTLRYRVNISITPPESDSVS